MALFNRKPKDSVLPEVDQYYEGERRDRAGLAWLLALVSVAVVALVIIGVFFAGRWAYRQIANNDDNGEVTVSDTTDDGLSFDGGSTNDDTDGSESSNDNEQGSSSQNDDTTENGQSDSSEAPAAGGDETPSVPSTGGEESTEALPSTGPADLGAVFVVVTAAAGAAHYAVTRKRAEQ